MLEQLKSAADHIFQISSKTKNEALKVRNSNFNSKEALEKNIVNKIEGKLVQGKICAVDGGLLAQEMHGVDLIIGRGAAVLFEYKDTKLENVEYHPNPFPAPEYIVEVGLDESEANCLKSLFRLRIELETAVNAIEKFNPKILFLDGSLIPLSQDRPSEGSEVFAHYAKVISLYKKLYSLCNEKNCLLIGISKDSRGKRFMSSIKEITNMRSSDTVFLNHLLEEKERTYVLRMSNHPKKHPVLRDLGEWSEKLNLFYIKPVVGDRPFRVEFLSSNDSYDEIASIVYSLSCINRSYAYPAILIEADLRAMLDPKEMERMQKTLQTFSSKEVLPLRRNSRPFR